MFTVEFEGLRAFRRRIKRVTGKLADFRPLFKALHAGVDPGGYLRPSKHGPKGEPFTRITRAQFDSRGSRAGSPWARYADEPKYRVVKIKFGGGLNRVLRWTPGGERLFPSFVDTAHPEHLVKIQVEKATFGSTVPYAKKHQYGQGISPYDKKPLPIRKLIDLTARDRRGWVASFARFLDGYTKPL